MGLFTQGFSMFLPVQIKKIKIEIPSFLWRIGKHIIIKSKIPLTKD